MMASLRRLWTGSLRRQLVMGVAAVHAVLMTLMVVDVVGRERQVIRDSTERQAVSVAQAVAASSQAWVLSNDVEGLAEVLAGMRSYPSLNWVMVVSPALRVLGHSDRAHVGEFLVDQDSLAIDRSAEARVLSSGERAVDAVAPIRGADQRLIGWARVSVSHDLAHATVAATLREGLLYTLMAIGAGVVFALMLAWRLTRDLQHLALVSDNVRRGLVWRNTIDREDEVGRLARDLNAMLDALEEQREGEERLRTELERSEARLSRALEAADEALWEYTANTGTVTFLARGERGLGIPGERDRNGATMPLAAWLERVHPEDQSAVQSAIEGNLRQLRADVRMRDTAQSWVLFEVRAAVERDGRGRVSRVAGTLMDVTGARALAAERRALGEQLQQAQKMDALGRVAGGVAHDFNNMLTAIIARAEALRDETVDLVVREELDQILAAARRAGGVTAQILAFSRGRVADTVPVEVSLALRELRSLVTPTLKGQVLEFAERTPGLWVAAERSGLVQVLLNLCVNARDFHRGDGPLRVSVDLARVEGTCASCRCAVSGEFVELAVSDRGPGISPEVLGRAFEPFFTTRRDTGGSGLGLAVVHGLVHGFDGHVLVNSSAEGTTFRVLLRVASPVPCPANQAAQATTDRPLKVLLVDDEPLVGRAMKRALERRGFDVRFEVSARSAIDVLTRDEFAVVVTDFTMPEMSGVELAHAITAGHRQVPVLICSGDPTQVQEDAQVAGVLAKPVDFDELSRAIQRLARH